jgi:hypothetical protein
MIGHIARYRPVQITFFSRQPTTLVTGERACAALRLVDVCVAVLNEIAYLQIHMQISYACDQARLRASIK